MEGGWKGDRKGGGGDKEMRGWKENGGGMEGGR